MQKLIEKYKDRTDVVFLTLNMDENPGLIAPYFKEHQLSLTVLPAYNYVYDTLHVFGIPQNWVVDPQGLVRLKGTGYDNTEKWELGMADAINRVSGARVESSSK